MKRLVAVGLAGLGIVAGTLATTLAYGQPVGRALVTLGSRLIAAGGGEPLPDSDAIFAVARAAAAEEFANVYGRKR